MAPVLAPADDLKPWLLVRRAGRVSPCQLTCDGEWRPTRRSCCSVRSTAVCFWKFWRAFEGPQRASAMAAVDTKPVTASYVKKGRKAMRLCRAASATWGNLAPMTKSRGSCASDAMLDKEHVMHASSLCLFSVLTMQPMWKPAHTSSVHGNMHTYQRHEQVRTRAVAMAEQSCAAEQPSSASIGSRPSTTCPLSEGRWPRHPRVSRGALHTVQLSQPQPAGGTESRNTQIEGCVEGCVGDA